jgi:putative redox protein
MAVEITGTYQGTKRVLLKHGPSGAELITDAPKDNNGEGASFSPTDLVATGLGACMLTIIAIVGERSELDLQGMSMQVEKHMSLDPRRIGRLPLSIVLPSHLSEDDRTKLERAALACPVHQSLHPDIEIDVQFKYE